MKNITVEAFRRVFDAFVLHSVRPFSLDPMLAANEILISAES